MRTFCLLLVSTCVAGMAMGCPAQTQPTPEQQDSQRVVVNAAEVPFDVVVRDKKGRAVTDLRASDFEVYEDGVGQQVNSFRLVVREKRGSDTVGGGSAGGNAVGPNSLQNQGAAQGNATPGGVEASPRLSAVAIVFDR